MRFYLDENVPSGTVQYLERKHSLHHIAFDDPFRGREDKFHHQQAKREKRILITLDEGFADREFSVNRHPGILILQVGKRRDYRMVNAILDKVLQRFKTAADFYETKIIASAIGYRRITREGEERGEWPEKVMVREEGVAYGEEPVLQEGARA